MARAEQSPNGVSSNSKSADNNDKQIQPVRLGVLVSSIGIGIFMSALDESIITVGIPKITIHFGTDKLHVQWVVLVYLLVIVALTAGAGHLGDRFSTKRVFQSGMVIFAVGSLLCALTGYSDKLILLILARMVQAVGAAGLLANGNAIVARFTDDEKRGLAIGLAALIAALGVVVGPALGGVMIQYLGWASVFWINVPIGVFGFIYVHFAIPPTPSLEKDENQTGDPFGSILFAVFMTAFITSITLFAETTINRPIMWSGICFGLSILLFIGFILWERRVKYPFINLKLFKNRKFTIGIFCALATYIALNSVAFQLPFYLNDILNYTTLQIGLVIMTVPIGLGITAPIFGKISSKVDSRILSSIGLGAIFLALLIGSLLIKFESPLWFYIIIAAIIGLAIGTFISPNSNSVMSSVPKDELGVVSGFLQLARNIGYTIGTALSTTIFYFILNLVMQETGIPGETAVENYVPTVKILFGILGVFMVIAIILSVFRGPETWHENNNSHSKTIEDEEATLE
ncbi:MAG: MFS transporter [Candidatus Heimdallarchaeota archaeon]|nr:MFS transporter [Candidatus Heimdallarchaeota archaeon]MBY8995794.1 MFS transporter [Candidatus Heimdallarchaeota archaeon]